MRLREDITDIIREQHLALLARRARAQEEITELVSEIQAIALHLDGLQEHSRGGVYPLLLGEALGMKPAAAADEARKLKTMAKRPVDKPWMIANGLLPAPPRRTPKAAKPTSPIMKVATLQETILTAKERGMDRQEEEIVRTMLAKLVKDFG